MFVWVVVGSKLHGLCLMIDDGSLVCRLVYRVLGEPLLFVLGG